MIDYLKTVLTRQYEASLCMLDGCVRRCPAEHWEGKIGNGTFRANYKVSGTNGTVGIVSGARYMTCGVRRGGRVLV